MAVVTIPKELSKKGDLVVIPRKEYEEYLRFKTNNIQQTSKKCDHGFKKSLEELRQGKTIGPFNNAKDLMKSLRASG